MHYRDVFQFFDCKPTFKLDTFELRKVSLHDRLPIDHTLSLRLIPLNAQEKKIAFQSLVMCGRP